MSETEAGGRRPFDYLAEAAVTCSPSWHGDKVPHTELSGALADFIAAGNRMDGIKKCLFYGRMPKTPFAAAASGITCEEAPEWLTPHAKDGEASQDEWQRAVDMFHAIIGVMTEATEMAELLQASVIFGKPFDDVNFFEESGDILWYLANGHRTYRRTLHETMHRNIAKLRHRFPDKFTEYDANNRDLVGERVILEGTAEPVPPVAAIVGPRNERRTAWYCKIGSINGVPVPKAADGPMRAAVEAAFFTVTGEHAQACFSGWDAEFNPSEKDVINNE